MSSNKISSRQLKKPQQYSFKNGRYEGGVVNAKRQGVGICVLDDGSIVIGEWLNDKLHGEAMIFLPNIGVIQGTYINGNPVKDNLLQVAVLYADNISVAFQVKPIGTAGGNIINGTCWNGRIGFEFTYENNQMVLKQIEYSGYEKYIEAVSALRNMSLLNKQQFKDYLNAAQTDNNHQTRYTLVKQQYQQASLGCVIDRYSLEVIQAGTYVNSQLDGLARIIGNTNMNYHGDGYNNQNKQNSNNYQSREYLDCIFIKGKIATTAGSNSNNKQFTVIPNESLLTHNNKEHQLFLQAQHKCSPDYFDISVNTKDILPYEYMFLKELPIRIADMIADSNLKEKQQDGISYNQYEYIGREIKEKQYLEIKPQQIGMSELFKGPFIQSIEFMGRIQTQSDNQNQKDLQSQQVYEYQNSNNNNLENIVACDQISNISNQIKQAYLFSGESTEYCRTLVDKITNVSVEDDNDKKEGCQDNQSPIQTGTISVQDEIHQQQCQQDCLHFQVENITANTVTTNIIKTDNSNEKPKGSQQNVQSKTQPSLLSLRAGKHFKGFYNEKDIKVISNKRDRSNNKTNQDGVFIQVQVDQRQGNVQTDGQDIKVVNNRNKQIANKEPQSSSIEKNGSKLLEKDEDSNDKNNINNNNKKDNGLEKIEEIVFNKINKKQHLLLQQKKWKSQDKSPYQDKSKKKEANESISVVQIPKTNQIEGQYNNNSSSFKCLSREREANQRQNNKAWQSVLQYPSKTNNNNNTIQCSVSSKNEVNYNQENKSIRNYQKRQNTLTLGDNNYSQRSNSKSNNSLSPYCQRRRQILSCRNAKHSEIVDDKENNFENNLQKDCMMNDNGDKKNGRNQRCQTLQIEGGYLVKIEEIKKQQNQEQSYFRCLHERQDEQDKRNRQNSNNIIDRQHNPSRSNEMNYQETKGQNLDYQINHIEKQERHQNQASIDQEMSQRKRQNQCEYQPFLYNNSKSKLHIDTKDGISSKSLNILPVCMQKQEQNNYNTYNQYTPKTINNNTNTQSVRQLQNQLTNLPSPSRDELLDREYFTQLKCNQTSLQFTDIQKQADKQQKDKDNQSFRTINSHIHIDDDNINGICGVMKPDLPERARQENCQEKSQQFFTECSKQPKQYEYTYQPQVSTTILNQQSSPLYPQITYLNGQFQDKDISQQNNLINNGKYQNIYNPLIYQDFQEQFQDKTFNKSPRSCFVLNYNDFNNSNALVLKANQYQHQLESNNQVQSNSNNNTSYIPTTSCYSSLQSKDTTPDRKIFRKHPSSYKNDQTQQIFQKQQLFNQ